MKGSWIFSFAVLVAVAVLVNLVSGAVLTNTLALAGTEASSVAKASIFSLLGHRYVAEVGGTLVLILALWITIARKRGRAAGLAGIALVLVFVEALLGRASAPLSPSVGFFHAILAEFLFAILVAVAVFTWPGWEKKPEQVMDKGWPSLRSLSNTTVGALVLQVMLGAAFRHNLASVLWHILGAFLVVVFGLCMLVIITQVPENRSLRPPVTIMGCLMGVQITLGMVLISFSQPTKHPDALVYTVAAHVLVGASTLGLGVITAMLVRRCVTPPAAG
ncbi:MAG TPA: COX15/CtaA family protein [Bryobacteraceae bacterium]|nr:COX15/CtaA family protein [Bryobacteraceae bacterium]